LNINEVLRSYRDPRLARKLVDKIHYEASKINEKILIMHVCGTHEWTITHYGIRSLLPKNIELRAGPGCPVCITPASDIDNVVKLTIEEGVIAMAYGDVSRAKGSKGLSLDDARSFGGNVRIVYSIQDAVNIALNDKENEYLFFGVGFDTTAPATAYMVLKGIPENLTILSSYRYVPPAVGAVLSMEDIKIDAVICPGHSSTVTGMKPYKKYFDQFKKPMVFAGFEPIDVLIAVYMILKQLTTGDVKMENEYTRSVTWDGNVKAMKTIYKVFNLVDGIWRGLGLVRDSAFEFKNEYRGVNARFKYDIEEPKLDVEFPSGCRCADVIKGKILPIECPLYMKACTPERPIGPCMVSIEGTCRIWYEHNITREVFDYDW